MRQRVALSGLVLILLTGGCSERPAPAAAAAAPAASYTPDSTRREQLARFREGTSPRTELTGGAADRDDLIRAFVEALVRADTAALRGMALSRDEFAWIYYPDNAQARPPYDLEPGLMWFLNRERSSTGLSKALALLAEHPLRYVDHHCDGAPSREGENTVYGPCLVRLVSAAGDTSEGRLFGLVLERHGRWKFVNFANRLD